MAAKRKTAEQAQETTTAVGENINTAVETTPTGAAEETASQYATAVMQEPSASQENSLSPGPDGKDHTLREPGDEPQKSWVKKASVIVDPEAGVKFSFDYEKHQAIITFDEKPTPELLAVARPILSAGGFEWDKVNKDGWKKKIPFLTREDARREAKKTFYTLANALRQQKGLPARSFGEVVAF